ncbi:hypothetical protein [Paenibacillus sedimenti]|uniref:Uncharacterized protein n=1 Tax=Paenibacillus sedimenti TaxID=2770274 RepID=A0A926QI94_9BACL|nr:hypothetical protein [Paenibacillus sedimenti]MBD0379107.1 hypothetical protein [Paenibacillus sedimenti]
MEQWIEFAFKHWYLVIIALTFFYQVRKKWMDASSKGSDKRRTIHGMPSFDGKLSSPSKPHGAPRSSEGHTSATKQPKRQQNEYGRSEAARTSTLSPERKESPFHSPASALNAFAESTADNQPGHSPELLSVQPTQQQLMQGIVWAEILGPPRSKKPYRR